MIPLQRLQGRFVVLEGIDGAGTTTQAEAIGAALTGEGRKVLVTREPSDGPVGSLARQALVGKLSVSGVRPAPSPATMALLFAADRVDHLAAEIIPAMQRGEIVICDRYLLSSLAYQGAELPLAWVEQINNQAVLPDLTLFLEVDVQTAALRRARRGGAAELYDSEEKQRRIAKQYLAVIRRRAAKERIVRLDGSLPAAEVTRLALGAIRKTLEV
ncbi:MAG: dTMP kinase [Myxococcota bacterium]